MQNSLDSTQIKDPNKLGRVFHIPFSPDEFETIGAFKKEIESQLSFDDDEWLIPIPSTDKPKNPFSDFWLLENRPDPKIKFTNEEEYEAQIITTPETPLSPQELFDLIELPDKSNSNLQRSFIHQALRDELKGVYKSAGLKPLEPRFSSSMCDLALNDTLVNLSKMDDFNLFGVTPADMPTPVTSSEGSRRHRQMMENEASVTEFLAPIKLESDSLHIPKDIQEYLDKYVKVVEECERLGMTPEEIAAKAASLDDNSKSLHINRDGVYTPPQSQGRGFENNKKSLHLKSKSMSTNIDFNNNGNGYNNLVSPSNPVLNSQSSLQSSLLANASSATTIKENRRHTMLISSANNMMKSSSSPSITNGINRKPRPTSLQISQSLSGSLYKTSPPNSQPTTPPKHTNFLRRSRPTSMQVLKSSPQSEPPSKVISGPLSSSHSRSSSIAQKSSNQSKLESPSTISRPHTSPKPILSPTQTKANLNNNSSLPTQSVYKTFPSIPAKSALRPRPEPKKPPVPPNRELSPLSKAKLALANVYDGLNDSKFPSRIPKPNFLVNRTKKNIQEAKILLPHNLSLDREIIYPERNSIVTCTDGSTFVSKIPTFRRTYFIK